MFHSNHYDEITVMSSDIPYDQLIEQR